MIMKKTCYIRGTFGTDATQESSRGLPMFRLRNNRGNAALFHTIALSSCSRYRPFTNARERFKMCVLSAPVKQILIQSENPDKIMANILENII